VCIRSGNMAAVHIEGDLSSQAAPLMLDRIVVAQNNAVVLLPVDSADATLTQHRDMDSGRSANDQSSTVSRSQKAGGIIKRPLSKLTKASKRKKCGQVGDEQPFRTLVVVPRSHIDDYTKLCNGRRNGRVKDIRDPTIVARAVQLDLRPCAPKPHSSLLIAWDSKVVHQGHTHSAKARGWVPPLLRPRLFAPKDSGWETGWESYLAKEGYVALTDVLPLKDVHHALGLLLRDLQLLAPELHSLAEVRERHLPPNWNDLQVGAGLCHGKFAWYLRTHPKVTRLCELLFDVPPGTPLVGSVDAVALAPPGFTDGKKAHVQCRKWLHLDYSPMQTVDGSGRRIWQTCLQLFPSSEEMGSRWERIAIMICKAPAAWSSLQAEHALLACCVSGAASKATAGVTLGEVHGKPCVKGHGEGQALPRRSQKRLLPELSQAPLLAVTLGSNNKVLDGPVVDMQHLDLRLQSPSVVMQRFSVEKLREMVPERVLHYISPKVAAKDSVESLLAASDSKHLDSSMEISSSPSPNAQFLQRYVFTVAGPRAAEYVPLLRKWAREGRAVHGKLFTSNEVEEAVQLSCLPSCGQQAGSSGSQSELCSVPTPVRAAASARAPQEAMLPKALHAKLTVHSNEVHTEAPQSKKRLAQDTKIEDSA